MIAPLSSLFVSLPCMTPSLEYISLPHFLPRYVAHAGTCRPDHITNVAAPHDATQTDIENKVEGLRDLEREALDRAGLSVQPSSSCASPPSSKNAHHPLSPVPFRVPFHRHTQSPDDMPPEKFLQSMIGYHLAYDNSLCGMVMTQGRQRQVINIGLGIKQLCVEPRGVSVAAYAESFAHKVPSCPTHRFAPC